MRKRIGLAAEGHAERLRQVLTENARMGLIGQKLIYHQIIKLALMPAPGAPEAKKYFG
jgi:hypothetical protein